MRSEIPVILRCCFCFPLRHGLLVWAYIKQVFSLLFLTYITLSICGNFKKLELLWKVSLPIIVILTIIDILFHVLFIISAHTKDYRKMRMFYRYSIVLLSINSAVFVLFTAICIFSLYFKVLLVFYLWPVILVTLFMFLIMIAAQIYLIILVKSEFMKLKNNSQFEFINQTAEEKCTANIDFVTIIPEQE